MPECRGLLTPSGDLVGRRVRADPGDDSPPTASASTPTVPSGMPMSHIDAADEYASAAT